MTETTHNPALEMEDNQVNALQSLFRGAADTIVEASKLRKEVNQLKTEVEELSKQVAQLRESNQLLDEALIRTRQERDETMAKLRDSELACAQHQNSLNETTYQRDHANDRANALSDRVDVLVRERDESISQVLHLEEENRVLKLRVEQVATLLGFKRDTTLNYLEQERKPSGQFGEPIKEVPNVVNF